MNLSEMVSQEACEYIQNICQTHKDYFCQFGVDFDEKDVLSVVSFFGHDISTLQFSSAFLVVYLPTLKKGSLSKLDLFQEKDFPIPVAFIDKNCECVSIDTTQWRALEPDEILHVFAEDGTFSRLLSKFSVREGQLAMASHVINALNTGNVVQIEAGTGVGKSLAYLVPAIYFAVLNDTRVLISTAGISLQQQLIEKDIPMVLQALNAPITASIAKGINNYVCYKKYIERQGALAIAQDSLAGEVFDWISKTNTGDIVEMSLSGAEKIIKEVTASHDHCSRHACPHIEKCFLRKARERMEEAKIIVTNHNLFLMDRNIRSISNESGGAIPEYSHVIVDEAHRLSEIGVSVFSNSMSKSTIERVFARIHGKSKKTRLTTILRPSSGGNEERKQARNITARVRKLMDYILKSLNEYEDLVRKEIRTSIKRVEDLHTKELLIADCIVKKPIAVLIESISISLDRLRALFRDVKKFSKDFADVSVHDQYLWERCVESVRTMHSFFKELGNPDEVENHVLFVREEEEKIEMHRMALDLSDTMYRILLEPIRTIVCTSATLSDSSVLHMWQRNLDPSQKKIIRVASPFLYDEQQLIAIPQDAPNIKKDVQGYTGFLSGMINAFASMLEGSTLVLFTSYNMMLDCIQQLKAGGIEKRFTLLIQSKKETRERLISRFKTETACILFGVDTFWEGIDFPGDTLRMLIIARLPFKAPRGVYSRARHEHIRAQMLDPFRSLSVPEAVQKLKQGIGRLIRTEEDFGVIVIGDRRVLMWKEFTDALSHSKLCIRDSADMAIKVRGFLDSFGAIHPEE